MTAHIETKKEDIADILLMPGDPLRAKYIADNFLEDAKLVNEVRNMYFYTGYYKGKRITVASSGMGMPSIGIYAYELMKFYDVKKIIRIGTCGSFHENIKLQDIILSTGAHALTYIPKLLDNIETKYQKSNEEINKRIETTAKENNIDIRVGDTITSDVFDPYCDSPEEFRKNFEGVDALGVEMESFALFYLAHKFNVEATTLLTVVDSTFDKRSLTSEERETGLNNMITLALESII